MCLKVLTIAKSPNPGACDPAIQMKEQESSQQGEVVPRGRIDIVHIRTPATSLQIYGAKDTPNTAAKWKLAACLSLPSICATVGALVVLLRSIKNLKHTRAKSGSTWMQVTCSWYKTNVIRKTTTRTLLTAIRSSKKNQKHICSFLQTHAWYKTRVPQTRALQPSYWTWQITARSPIQSARGGGGRKIAQREGGGEGERYRQKKRDSEPCSNVSSGGQPRTTSYCSITSEKRWGASTDRIDLLSSSGAFKLYSAHFQ